MEFLPISDAQRPLGTTSLRVFPLAYGCWRFAGTDVRHAREKVEAALESGINLFDHADVYGGNGAAEELFGKVVAETPHLRDSMLIATKCGIIPGVPYDSSARHIARAAEASLRRLRIDVIDLYQIHRPDMLAHPEEVATALAQLRAQGKIREVGVSNFSAAQFEALQHYLPFPVATHQPEFSAWWLEVLRNGIIDQCMQRRVTLLAWSPMAGGKLGLSVEQAATETNGGRLASLIECLDGIAAAQQTTRTGVALAFLLTHPAGVVPILGTQRVERIRDSLATFKVRLRRVDWYAIVQASQGKRLP